MRSRVSTRGSQGIEPIDDAAVELREVDTTQRKRPRQRQQQQHQQQQRRRGAKSNADRHAALDEHVRKRDRGKYCIPTTTDDLSLA